MKKKIWKRVIPASMVCLLLNISVGIIDSVGAESTYTLNEYLQSQINNHSTELDVKTESDLNAQGIFDTEIEQLSADVLNSIEDGDDYYISVDYYSETLIDKEEGKSSLDKMSDTSVDRLVNDKYGHLESNQKRIKLDGQKYILDYNDGSIEKESNKDESTPLSKVKKLYFNKINAATDSGYTDSGKVKRVLVATHPSGKDYIQCSLVYTWVESPKYTLTDEMCMYVKNGTPVYSTVSTSYSFNELAYYGTTANEHSYKITNVECVKNNYGVAIKQDLKTSVEGAIYSDHSLAISYRANIDNQKSWKYVEVNGQYYHQQTVLSVDPTLSLGVDGSISLSASISSKFQELTNPPQVFVYF